MMLLLLLLLLTELQFSQTNIFGLNDSIVETMIWSNFLNICNQTPIATDRVGICNNSNRSSSKRTNRSNCGNSLGSSGLNNAQGVENTLAQRAFSGDGALRARVNFASWANHHDSWH